MPGLDATDAPIQWTPDGKAVFTGNPGAFPLEVKRLDLSSGVRTTVATVSTSDPNGVFSIDSITATPDGKTFVYSYLRVLTSSLYVIDGLR